MKNDGQHHQVKLYKNKQKKVRIYNDNSKFRWRMTSSPPSNWSPEALVKIFTQLVSETIVDLNVTSFCKNCASFNFSASLK